MPTLSATTTAAESGLGKDDNGSDREEHSGGCAESHSSEQKTEDPEHAANSELEGSLQLPSVDSLEEECSSTASNQEEGMDQDEQSEEGSISENEKNNAERSERNNAEDVTPETERSEKKYGEDGVATNSIDNETEGCEENLVKDGETSNPTDMTEKSEKNLAENVATSNASGMTEGSEKNGGDCGIASDTIDGKAESLGKKAVEEDEASNPADVAERSEKNAAEDVTTSNVEHDIAADATDKIERKGRTAKRRKKGEDGDTPNATPSKQSEDVQLPPPSWPDVTFDQLVKYPKRSLRAQSYFDIQQIRAIKPVTLLAMGISVPKFPDLENDGIIKFAIKRTKHQLYHPTDVLFTSKSAKSYLQKEILRRFILSNLGELGEDVSHDDIPKKSLLRQVRGRGIVAGLPRPKNFSHSQCIEWLKNNPLAEQERSFVLKSARQWRRQVRDQIRTIQPKTEEMHEALAEPDPVEEEEEESMAQPVIIAAPSVVGNDGQLHAAFENYTKQQAAFENYTNHLLANPVINYNNPITAPNGINFQSQLAAAQGQLASAVNMNNLQAQVISQYQNQLAALQTQLTTATKEAVASKEAETQFEIFVSKDTFKFNASHFVAYPGFRERLHGHSYRASVKLIGSHQIGRDGYVLDFGCVKSVTKVVCKELNEYFLVPILSEVLKITVEDDEDEGGDLHGKKTCGDCDFGGKEQNPRGSERKKARKRKRSKWPGSVAIECEDGSLFVFPRQDCLLLPIMHSTAEELAVYIYGKILESLDAGYLRERGVTAMEVTVSEAVGQDAAFRNKIPTGKTSFDVAAYISKEAIPVMPCATETEAAKQRKRDS